MSDFEGPKNDRRTEHFAGRIYQVMLDPPYRELGPERNCQSKEKKMG